jgi:ribosome-associated protein
LRLNKTQKAAVAALEDIKARDITVLDTRPLTAIYDTLIVATAESARQTKALARHVRDKVREAGGQVLSVEGEETGEWVLVDCTEMVVHIMLPTTRALYNLEELWTAPAAARPPKAAKPAVAAPATAPKATGSPKAAAARASTKKPAAAPKVAPVPAPAARAAVNTDAKKPARKPVTKSTGGKAVATRKPVAKKAAAKTPAAKPPTAKIPAAKKPAAKPAATKKPGAKKPATRRSAT